ncbi:MAG: WG repeat-containing protein [Candidatus Adiutrix sp.]|jgi:hypothetical protein|nr:WG repeat-containing protein [Candidatus Adiutrix sp.]
MNLKIRITRARLKVCAAALLAGLFWAGLSPAPALAKGYLAVACLRRNADQCGVINEKGEWLARPDFDQIGDFAPNGLAWAVKGRRVGLINARGEWVLRPEFDRVDPQWSAGLIKVARAGRASGLLYGLVNETGQVVAEPSFRDIQAFGPNRLAGACDREDRCGFINSAGAWAVAPVFGQVGPFAANGLAPARRPDETQWGYINAAGDFVIPPGYEIAFPFDGDRAKVRADGLYGLINAKGQWVGRLRLASLGDFDAKGLAPAQQEADGLFGLVNRGGGWAVPPRFERLHGFGGGSLAPAQKDGLFGFINRGGQWVIKPAFGNVHDFEARGRRAPAEKNGAWGLINAEGQWVVKPAHLMLLDSGRPGGIFHVFTESGHWGLMDENGRWLLEPALSATPFFAENGLSEARDGEFYGFIDRAGRWVVAPSFQQVGVFKPVPAVPPPLPESARPDRRLPQAAPATTFNVGETASAKAEPPEAEPAEAKPARAEPPDEDPNCPPEQEYRPVAAPAAKAGKETRPRPDPADYGPPKPGYVPPAEPPRPRPRPKRTTPAAPETAPPTATPPEAAPPAAAPETAAPEAEPAEAPPETDSAAEPRPGPTDATNGRARPQLTFD